MKKREFDSVWDAERILNNYLRFADRDGFLKDLRDQKDYPYKIRQDRFLAAMKAYGRDEEQFYPSGIMSFEGGSRALISKSHSSSKITEFRELLAQVLSDNVFCGNMLNDANCFTMERDISLAFERLLIFRMELYAIDNMWSSTLEASKSLGLVYKATRFLYEKHLSEVSNILDRMLVLLMGDDYDKHFKEHELFQYGYPDVTDAELEEREENL